MILLIHLPLFNNSCTNGRPDYLSITYDNKNDNYLHLSV